MKPTAVADEMFPEGAGTYVDAEEVINFIGLNCVIFVFIHCRL